MRVSETGQLIPDARWPLRPRSKAALKVGKDFSEVLRRLGKINTSSPHHESNGILA